MVNQRKSGVILSYLTLFIKIAIAMVYTPFLIHSLGKSEYGIFNITVSILSYMAILDFGVNDSTIRYLVQIKNQLNLPKSKEILAGINLFYSSIGIGIIGIGTLLYFNLDTFFGQSMDGREIYLLEITFLIALVSTLFSIVMNPFSAILMAYEKFALLKWIELISYLLTTGLIVVFLLLGYKLVAVVYISAIINILGIVYKIYYVKRKLKFPYSLLQYSTQTIKTLLNYSSPIFLVVVVEQIYWKLDNILIGSYLGASMVAIYAAGIFFQKYILSFSTSISRVMIPNFIDKLDQNVDLRERSRLYIKVGRIQLMSILLIVTTLGLYGYEFIQLWLGPDFTLSYYVLLAIMIPQSLEVVGNIRNTVLQVKGLYWFRARLIFFISLINIGFTIYFLKVHQSIVLAAVSTGVGILLGYIIINTYIHIKQLLDIKYFILSTWIAILPTILILGIANIGLSFMVADRWFPFFIKIGIHIAICIWTLYLIYMNTEEKNMIKKLVNQLKTKIVGG
ncbi:oligosaccharide flippase family protein [Membranihabitans marinus]|uniref:oligosaccharide flippase family protein n=1 Tax=Membranihabitans marinus TaxID=1227546 RepID=UPI001F02939D|nr:oligosaccharide flippase family protein [Membranihabitans marinus]